MKTGINISVIVPSYNREKTIERCINSIRNQTEPPYEIIVVDDGSTDMTLDILHHIQDRDLKIIKQRHRGAQAARNLGVLNAEGNYIAFLDSDDEWLPQTLECEKRYLLKEKEDCVLYANCYVQSSDSKKLWELPGKSGNMYKFLLIHQGPMFQSMLIKKELFLRCGMLDEDVVAYQEWDTAIRLAQKAKFVHLREPLFIYYLHEGETISKDKRKEVEGYAYIVKKYQKEIVKNHGLKGLNYHYKILVNKCYKYKDVRLWLFFLKAISISMLLLIEKYKENKNKM